MKNKILGFSIAVVMIVSVFVVNSGMTSADVVAPMTITEFKKTDNHRLDIKFGMNVDYTKINMTAVHLYYTDKTMMDLFGKETTPFVYGSMKQVPFETKGIDYFTIKFLCTPGDENFTVGTLSMGNDSVNPNYPEAIWGDTPHNLYVVFDEGALCPGSPLQYVGLRGDMMETMFGLGLPEALGNWIVANPMPTPEPLPTIAPIPTPKPEVAVKKPAKVSGLKVLSNKKKTAVITWKKAKDAKGYEVYRSLKKNGGFKKIATTSKLKYTDKKVKSKKTYYFKLKAFNKSGSKKVDGAFSAVKKIKIK